MKQKNVIMWSGREKNYMLFYEKSLFGGHQMGTVEYMDQTAQGILHS